MHLQRNKNVYHSNLRQTFQKCSPTKLTLPTFVINYLYFESMHTKEIQNTYWSNSISNHSSKVLVSKFNEPPGLFLRLLKTIGFAYQVIIKFSLNTRAEQKYQ